MVANFELWFSICYIRKTESFPELLILYGAMTATMFCGCSQHRRHQSRTKTVFVIYCLSQREKFTVPLFKKSCWCVKQHVNNWQLVNTIQVYLQWNFLLENSSYLHHPWLLSRYMVSKYTRKNPS